MIELAQIERARQAVHSVDAAAIEQAIETEGMRREERRHYRELTRNTGRTTFKCVQCGKFKSRPSAICGGANCGDHPMPLNTEPNAYDREHGWDDGGADFEIWSS